MINTNENIMNIQKLFYERNNEIILNNISLKINYKDFIVLIGANGTGKSTLIKHFNKIHLPQGGYIYYQGKNINSIETFELRKNISMIFQNPENQIVASIVEDDIAFALENLGLNEFEINKRINYVLEMVELENYRYAQTHSLSGGQKQRLAIASVLAIDPCFLILDEATSMLDPKNRRKILNILKKLNIIQNKTILLITHDMEEASEASRIIVMDNGKIKYDDTPKKIFEKIEILNSMNLEVPLTVKLLYKLKIKFKNNLPINGLNINEFFSILKRFIKIK